MVQQKQMNPNDQTTSLILGASVLGIVLLGIGGIWLALHGAAKLAGEPAPETHPISLVLGLARGEVAWSTWATAIASAIALVVVALGVAITGRVLKAQDSRQSSDKSARYMGTSRDVRPMLEPARRKQAARLGVKGDGFGLPLGKVLPSKLRIYSSLEDMLILIAGPRTMKSTAYAIPLIMAAPGPVLATSNKRDVVDATRGPRSSDGRTIWIFDPQRVAEEPPTWWWNPLSFVTNEARAEKLAAQFATSARGDNAKTDSYFDAEAENLISLLLLAAARGQMPITQVYSWLTLPSEQEPVEILQGAGFTLHAQSLYALILLPDKQRDGVYGTARSLMGFLRNTSFVEWVTPPAVPGPTEFSPDLFARSMDTLYLLSREGGGGAGALVAALTVAVSEAAEQYATASPGGRMPVPFVGVLDEAANICRFKGLDSLYSHYGSRGILFLTILQNWAQGEQVWGRDGMEKLWSASNVKMYGGGVDDDRFLRRMSDLIGSYERIQTSTSSSSNGYQRSRSVQEKPILTPSELRELKNRAIVFASGTPALMIEPQPWFVGGPHVDAISASLALHGSGASGSTGAPAPTLNPPTSGEILG